MSIAITAIHAKRKSVTVLLQRPIERKKMKTREGEGLECLSATLPPPVSLFPPRTFDLKTGPKRYKDNNEVSSVETTLASSQLLPSFVPEKTPRKRRKKISRPSQNAGAKFRDKRRVSLFEEARWHKSPENPGKKIPGIDEGGEVFGPCVCRVFFPSLSPFFFLSFVIKSHSRLLYIRFTPFDLLRGNLALKRPWIDVHYTYIPERSMISRVYLVWNKNRDIFIIDELFLLARELGEWIEPETRWTGIVTILFIEKKYFLKFDPYLSLLYARWVDALDCVILDYFVVTNVIHHFRWKSIRCGNVALRQAKFFEFLEL